VMTGIGGQGIQLAAQVLARAALVEGREVQLFGNYGGMMRGGSTEATLVFADEPILAPPTVSHTWSAIFMHHEYGEPTRQRLRDGSLVLRNSTIVGPEFDHGRYTVVDVPATDLAGELGNIMTASMVMAGAYVAVTRLVGLESVVAVLADALPTYRAQHLALNVSALSAGFNAAPGDIASAWAVMSK